MLLKEIKRKSKTEDSRKNQKHKEKKLSKNTLNISQRYNNDNTILKQIILNSKYNNKGIKNFDNIVNKKDNFPKTERQSNVLNSLNQSKINKMMLEEIKEILNSQKLDNSIHKSNKKILDNENLNNMEIKTFLRRNRKLYTINRKIVNSNIWLKNHTRIYKTLNNNILYKALYNKLNNINFEKDVINKLSSISKNYLLSLFFHTTAKKEIINNDSNKKYSISLSPKEITSKSNNKEETNLNDRKKFLRSYKKKKTFYIRKNNSKINALRNQNNNKSFQRQKNSQYEMDKLTIKNYENLKSKIEEINEISEKVKEEKLKIKSRTSIFNYNKQDKKPIIKENLFIKKLKEEKYRNILKKLTTRRKIDKFEYNQLKLELDLNISDSSGEERNEEIDDDVGCNEKLERNNKGKKEDDEFCESEIDFYGVEIKIRQNKKEKELYEKYMKLKQLKYLRDLKQMKISNIFRKELEEGVFNEKENQMINEINKRLFTKRKKNKIKTKSYFKFDKKKYINSLDEEYHSDDSIQKYNYFLDIDVESKKEIENKKEQILLRFKNDIIYKIKKRELTFNELFLYDELENKLKNFENNLSNKKYIKLLNKYFNNFEKQLEISERKKMKEYRINHFMNNLRDDMDFLLEKKKKQENDFCQVLNYNEFNHINKLSDVNSNKAQ